MAPDLFTTSAAIEALADGIVLLRHYASTTELLPAIEHVTTAAPPRHMTTPGGKAMSVAMTNCGDHGWVTDSHGYRYSAMDPHTGKPWPAIPAPLSLLATEAAAQAGFDGFHPDVCLINHYQPGARLGLHRDEDEKDFTQPIVSASLGLSATFIIGGLTRQATKRHIELSDGDVIVFGGPARLIYHGIKPLSPGEHPLTGSQRINLTFRKAGR